MRGGGKETDAKDAFLVLSSDGRLICAVIRQGVSVGKDPVYILFATTDRPLVESVMKQIKNAGGTVPDEVYGFDGSKIPCIMITGGLSKRGLVLNYVKVSGHTDSSTLESIFSNKSTNKKIELNEELENDNGDALMVKLKGKNNVKPITDLEYRLRGFWAKEAIFGELNKYQKKLDDEFKGKHSILAYNMRCIAGLYASIKEKKEKDKFTKLQEVLDNLKSGYDKAMSVRGDTEDQYWVGQFMNIIRHINVIGPTAGDILKVMTEFQNIYSHLPVREKEILVSMVSQRKRVDFIPEHEQQTISSVISPDRLAWNDMKTFFEKLAATETPSGSSAGPVSPAAEVVSGHGDDPHHDNGSETNGS